FINGRAPAQRGVREGRAAVVLQRAEQWIGVYLVAGRRQEAAAAVAAQVVTVRGDGRPVSRFISVKDIFARSTGLQDGAADVHGRSVIGVVDAAAGGGRVAAQGAVVDRQRREPGVVDAAAVAAG